MSEFWCRLGVASSELDASSAYSPYCLEGEFSEVRMASVSHNARVRVPSDCTLPILLHLFCHPYYTFRAISATIVAWVQENETLRPICTCTRRLSSPRLGPPSSIPTAAT